MSTSANDSFDLLSCSGTWRLRTPSTLESLPLIARVSGLPSDTMRQFATGLREQLQQVTSSEAELGNIRVRLIDELHADIHNAPSEKRHALLAIKRDCFNGRPLRGHREAKGWSFLEHQAKSLAEEIVVREAEVESARKDFEAAYHREAFEQYDRLSRLLNEPMFSCGLAVASHTVASEAGRLRSKRPQDYGRREKRLAGTLLRYVSRASVKLSPFSTFTPVGLCEVSGGSEPLRLLSADWDRQSTVRLRRHILDRCSDMLCLYLPFRSNLRVRVNDSIAQLEDGRTLHRRPPRFHPDRQANELAYQRESLVRASLRTRTAERLSSLLDRESLTYERALQLLNQGADGEAATSTRAELDQLIELGFFYLELPWSCDEGHLESAMLRELRTIIRFSQDSHLQRLVEVLERVVTLEDELLRSPEPANSLQKLQASMDELLRRAGELASLPTDMRLPTYSVGHEIYQDVWCSPRQSRTDPIVSVGRKRLEEAHRNIRPLLNYSRIFDRKLDFLFSAGAALQEKCGPLCRLPLLNAFDLLAPLFRDFVASEAQVRTIDQHYFTWNPFGLAELEELSSVRKSLREGIKDCCADRDDGRHIVTTKLKLLLEAVPQKFKSEFGGACAFLQPADQGCHLWVANRIKEGTGRMSSRYTPLMPSSFACDYAAALAQRAGLPDRKILDVHSISGDTLNVHYPQTEKVLVLPCTHAGTPEHQRLSMGELFIRVGEDGWPLLEDVAGQSYTAAYIGLAGSTYLPTLIKFLCAFGPTDTIPLYPDRLQHLVDDVVVRERTLAGNVVLTRKSWAVPSLKLRTILQEPGTPAAFEQLHKFLARIGIPQRVFVAEKLNSFPRGRYQKPQFLDLSSPLFITILHSIVAAAEEPIVFVEALPDQDSFLQDAYGRRWAVELIADSLALEPLAKAEPHTEERPSSGSLTSLHLQPTAAFDQQT